MVTRGAAALVGGEVGGPAPYADIVVAGREFGGSAPTRAADAEQELTLYGLVGLQDPPRTDVGDALAACRSAGVRMTMVTGDHPVTASAIATQVGLRHPDGPVVVGADLPADLLALGALLDHDGIVVARVAPEDKLRIAQALREADIGIAMGASGTDVARKASDLVLLNDHFASIVEGIEMGVRPSSPCAGSSHSVITATTAATVTA